MPRQSRPNACGFMPGTCLPPRPGPARTRRSSVEGRPPAGRPSAARLRRTSLPRERLLPRGRSGFRPSRPHRQASCARSGPAPHMSRRPIRRRTRRRCRHCPGCPGSAEMRRLRVPDRPASGYPGVGAVHAAMRSSLRRVRDVVAPNCARPAVTGSTWRGAGDDRGQAARYRSSDSSSRSARTRSRRSRRRARYAARLWPAATRASPRGV